MEIVNKIINLRTVQENHKHEVEKYNYYKRINDEDRKIINQRNEYYIFLLQCIKTCYIKITECDLDYDVDKIFDVYDFKISNDDVIKKIKEFLQLNDIGKIDSENRVIGEHSDYTNINIKFDCSFEDFFKAFYNEIQYMEYYETTKEDAQKKYNEFLERDEQRYRKYIWNHQEEIIQLLPNANNNSIPANQVYRVIKMLEDHNYGKYGIDKLKYIVADLYKLGFSTEKIMEFTKLSEESVEKHKQLGR